MAPWLSGAGNLADEVTTEVQIAMTLCHMKPDSLICVSVHNLHAHDTRFTEQYLVLSVYSAIGLLTWWDAWSPSSTLAASERVCNGYVSGIFVGSMMPTFSQLPPLSGNALVQAD